MENLKKKIDFKISQNIKLNKFLAYKAKQANQFLDLEQEGFIIPDEGEETNKMSQDYIKNFLPNYNVKNIFNLHLPKGPFNIDFSNNGTSLLLCSRVCSSLIDWKEKDNISTVDLSDNKSERIIKGKFINGDRMFALSQREKLYIYDREGLEIHSLDRFSNPRYLENLPYHFLLVCSLKNNYIKYLDYSIGKIVSEIKTKSAEITCMTQNIQNSIIVTGHSNGTVNFWSPNYNSEPVVKMLTHPNSVTNVVIDNSGNYLTTTGVDKKMKVYDLRNTYEQVFEYFTPSQVYSLAISQKGLLAVGNKSVVEIWKNHSLSKQQKPYLKHHFENKQIYPNSMQFINFEDFLGIGTNNGYTQLSIPGSGEPNFDTYENNPFESKNQRKNNQIHKLLEKIPYTMININSESLINTIDYRDKNVVNQEKKNEIKFKSEEKYNEYKKKEKKKMRLKSKEKHKEIVKNLDKNNEKRNKLRAKMEINNEKIQQERKAISNEISVLKKIDQNDFNPELYLDNDDDEDNNDIDSSNIE